MSKQESLSPSSYEFAIVNGIIYSANLRAAEMILGKYIMRLTEPVRRDGFLAVCMPRVPGTQLQILYAIDTLPKTEDKIGPNLGIVHGFRWRIIAESLGLVDRNEERFVLSATQRDIILNKHEKNKYKAGTIVHFGFWLLSKSASDPSVIPTGIVNDFYEIGEIGRNKFPNYIQGVAHFEPPIIPTTMENLLLQDINKIAYFSDSADSQAKQALMVEYMTDSHDTFIKSIVDKNRV